MYYEEILLGEEFERLPSGATLFKDFIDEKREKELLSWVDSQMWSQELKRRVQHYGFRYDYKARKVDQSLDLGQLPTVIENIALKLTNEGVFIAKPDQVIVNEYLPGQGIASHVDCPCFGDTIASLTLGSGCVMKFSLDEEKTDVFLERRSLIQLQAEARYIWKHGIMARKSDVLEGIRVQRRRRVSLTFRRIGGNK